MKEKKTEKQAALREVVDGGRRRGRTEVLGGWENQRRASTALKVVWAGEVRESVVRGTGRDPSHRGDKGDWSVGSEVQPTTSQGRGLRARGWFRCSF